MTDLSHDADRPARASAHPQSLWVKQPAAADRAIALYREGKTAPAIMAAMWEEFGERVSRASVQGLMHRRGVRRSERGGVTVVTERMRTVAAGRPIKVRLAPRVTCPVVFGARPRLAERPAAPPASAETAAAPIAPAPACGSPEGVPLIELDRTHCRWPLWADDAPAWSERRFCGAARHAPDARLDCYCADHAALAFVPQEKRQRGNR